MTRPSALSFSMSSADNAIAAHAGNGKRARRARRIGAPRSPPGAPARQRSASSASRSRCRPRASPSPTSTRGSWPSGARRSPPGSRPLYLLATRAPRPTREQARSLAIVAAGVIVGFPLLTSLALEVQTAAHGAVVIAILPAATAVAAVRRAHEHPSRAFWLAACAGLVAVLAFVLTQGVGRPRRRATPSCSAPSCCARSATPRAARSAARSAARRRSAGRSCSARR